MVKKRTAPRAATRKGAKKKSAKKAAMKAAGSPSQVVRAGAAYATDKGVNLRPLKKAIRQTIELLAKSKESSKVASALESLVAVQQHLSAECRPDMILPNS